MVQLRTPDVALLLTEVASALGTCFVTTDCRVGMDGSWLRLLLSLRAPSALAMFVAMVPFPYREYALLPDNPQQLPMFLNRFAGTARKRYRTPLTLEVSEFTAVREQVCDSRAAGCRRGRKNVAVVKPRE